MNIIQAARLVGKLGSDFLKSEECEVPLLRSSPCRIMQEVNLGRQVRESGLDHRAVVITNQLDEIERIRKVWERVSKVLFRVEFLAGFQILCLERANFHLPVGVIGCDLLLGDATRVPGTCGTFRFTYCAVCCSASATVVSVVLRILLRFGTVNATSCLRALVPKDQTSGWESVFGVETSSLACCRDC